MRKPRLFEPEVPIPEEIREAVELWTAYKREQFRFTYKPLALAALVERMAAMGPERAMAAVKWSMHCGYEGLFEEKKQNGLGKADEPFCTPEQLAHVRRIVALRQSDGGQPVRSPAYLRKVFESLGPEAFEPGYMAYVENAYNRLANAGILPAEERSEQ